MMRKNMSERRSGWVVGVAVAISVWASISMIVEAEGKRWAVLVAGSNGYDNYRHQADVCHAYQILRKGGLRDENVIVFMYDDIAFDPSNPRPGVLVNKPYGPDVYEGVPKDYTGIHANAQNLYAVIAGNRSGVTGGSGKVLDSGPNDTIFIYYADHGTAGILGMPAGEDVYANELVSVLKKKHAAKGYKSMVIYVEACESGSMFEGILPNDINIYATTASNADESSYAIYCSDYHPSAPPEYGTCLGDVYSVSWMEDCDKHDMAKESLEQQYQTALRRTLYGDADSRSHVMQFGNKNLSKNLLATYIGVDPDNINRTLNVAQHTYSFSAERVPQEDVQLLYLAHKVRKAPNASKKKQEAQKELLDELSNRKHVDNSIRFIGDLLFGQVKSSMVLAKVRPQDQPLVDDWDCFKTLMNTYQRHCGTLSRYGKRHSRAFANMCNAGITVEQVAAASSQACPNKHHASNCTSFST